MIDYKIIYIFIFILLIVRSIDLNVNNIVNIIVFSSLIAYLYYNDNKIKSDKEKFVKTIDNVESLDNIDNKTYKVIEKLNKFKKFNNKSIDDGIIHINYFYKDIENKEDIIKANENRKNGINLLLSVMHSIDDIKIENEYITLVNKINYITKFDYENKVQEHNKTGIILDIDGPEPKDIFFNKNFSLI